jgi:2-polyprenyl-3-methyl-5-hydroxy-6-metoxy-1,4-benzoquinol methylase
MKAATDQVDHYNEFGRLYHQAIVNSIDPGTWTADPDPSSPINHQMRERIALQEQVVKKYLNTNDEVLDLGCGFGRQSFMMVKNGYKVTGVDSSDILIDIAKELVQKKGLKANFLCDSIWNFNKGKLYKQVTLFDVVEHFRPDDRKIFMHHLAEKICTPGATVIITIPYMSSGSVKHILINAYKSFTSNFPALSAKKEHPYPLPYKSTIESLLSPFFKLKEYLHNSDTAFFILERV